MNPEKRKQILQLLAGGDITADEAAELLNKPDAETSAPAKPVAPEAKTEPEAAKAPAAPTPAPAPKGRPSWLRIQVEDGKSGRSRVNVNIPVRMLRLGLKLGSRFAPEVDRLDLNEIESLLDEAATGVLVEVEDNESGEHVRITLD